MAARHQQAGTPSAHSIALLWRAYAPSRFLCRTLSDLVESRRISSRQIEALKVAAFDFAVRTAERRLETLRRSHGDAAGARASVREGVRLLTERFFAAPAVHAAESESLEVRCAQITALRVFVSMCPHHGTLGWWIVRSREPAVRWCCRH